MEICPDCKIRVFEVDEGVFRCSSCGMYWEYKEGFLVPYSLKAYPYNEMVRRSLEIVGLGIPRVEEGEETAVPVDPMFREFLKSAAQYGAPESVEAFSGLGAKDKQYYLRAYQIYLRDMQKQK